MALTDGETRKGTELLLAAIRDPFAEPHETDAPIHSWFSFLVEHMSVAVFQKDAYRRLAGDLPTTDPLADILKSVLGDEGWRGWHFPLRPRVIDHLPLNLAARREELVRGTRRRFRSCLVRRDDGGWRVDLRHDLSGVPEIEAIRDYDHDGFSGWYTEYEELGRELLGRIEARKAAASADEKEAAQRALEEFLEEVGAKAPAHRESTDPPKDVLDELFTQGRVLLEILWTPLEDVGPSKLACEILADLGADAPEFHQWALRLAIPALSWPEIQALLDQRHQAANWTRRMKRPTARRLAVWILARRLGAPAERIANKVGAGSDWDYFKEEANPVDAFAPGPGETP